jgi:hypothetical protein
MSVAINWVLYAYLSTGGISTFFWSVAQLKKSSMAINYCLICKFYSNRFVATEKI